MSPFAPLSQCHRSDTLQNVTARLLLECRARSHHDDRTSSDLGALIRERRIKLGLDQISLAKKAGTSRKWLIEVESGKPRAEIGLILRTLKALGVALTVSDSAADIPPNRTKGTRCGGRYRSGHRLPQETAMTNQLSRPGQWPRNGVGYLPQRPTLVRLRRVLATGAQRSYPALAFYAARFGRAWPYEDRSVSMGSVARQ